MAACQLIKCRATLQLGLHAGALGHIIYASDGTASGAIFVAEWAQGDCKALGCVGHGGEQLYFQVRTLTGLKECGRIPTVGATVPVR